jgi:putative Holliday junction resolvase
LDLGERRIGLAVGDTSTTLVFPAGHLSRSRLSDDLDKILETSGERRIEGIVVGMPYSLDGTHGTQAKRVNGFINALRKRTFIPIYTIDERFTSVEAEALIRDSGRQPSRLRGSVDEAAAALILQRFLAARGDDFA